MDQKTISEHFTELKNRFAICLVSVVIGSGVGFAFHKQIEGAIQRPLGQKLYYTSPAGGLAFVMQIAILSGVLLAMPVILYQIAQYVRPAVKPIKLKTIIIVITISMMLCLVAGIYAYYIGLPAALSFLTTFNSESIQPLISVNDYLQFIFAYFFGAVVTFQVPLILVFTNKIRRFPPGGLTKLQRPVILLSIVVAGVITPTVDPVNQMLIALPIIFLFEVGAVFVWIGNRRQTKRKLKLF